MKNVILILGLWYALRRLDKKTPPNIYYVKSLPGILRGICVPPFGIFILEEYRWDERLKEHELVHWQQYLDNPFFAIKYSVQWLQYGYSDHPMEMEARQNLTEFERNNYVDIFQKHRLPENA